MTVFCNALTLQCRYYNFIRRRRRLQGCMTRNRPYFCKTSARECTLTYMTAARRRRKGAECAVIRFLYSFRATFAARAPICARAPRRVNARRFVFCVPFRRAEGRVLFSRQIILTAYPRSLNREERCRPCFCKTSARECTLTYMTAARRRRKGAECAVIRGFVRSKRFCRASADNAYPS